MWVVELALTGPILDIWMDIPKDDMADAIVLFGIKVVKFIASERRETRVPAVAMKDMRVYLIMMNPPREVPEVVSYTPFEARSIPFQLDCSHLDVLSDCERIPVETFVEKFKIKGVQRFLLHGALLFLVPREYQRKL